MPTRIYDGPSAVHLLLADGSMLQCEPGVAVDVPDHLVAGLDVQDCWRNPKATSTAAPTVKSLKADLAALGVDAPKGAKKAQLQQLLGAAHAVAPEPPTQPEPDSTAPAADAGDPPTDQTPAHPGEEA